MWHAVLAGAGLGSGCREKWLCTSARRSWTKSSVVGAAGVTLTPPGWG